MCIAQFMAHTVRGTSHASISLCLLPTLTITALSSDVFLITDRFATYIKGLSFSFILKNFCSALLSHRRSTETIIKINTINIQSVTKSKLHIWVHISYSVMQDQLVLQLLCSHVLEVHSLDMSMEVKTVLNQTWPTLM